MQTKKNKLIGLLLLVVSVAFGQQVPNTTTFKLDTVVDVVGPTTNDLSDCFSDANPDYFNDTYNDDAYAPANSLLRFRDYGSHNAVSVVAPTVVTNAASGITYSYADLNGNVTSNGGATLTDRGFQIASNSLLTGAVTVTNLGQTGSYTSGYNTYCNGTTYYYRAFATNSAGTSYGEIVSFNTSSITLTGYRFYTQVDGVTINSEATALAGSNAAFWSKLGTNTYTTKYLSTVSVDEIVYNGTSPSCKAISSNTWYVVTDGTSVNVWAVNVSSSSIVLSAVKYSSTVIGYTASTTFVVPSNIKYVQVECWGGGGAGGPATGTGARAAGGAGGSYAKKVVTVTAGSSQAITIGAGGTASTSAIRSGTATTFSSSILARANGGQGGAINSTTGGASATIASTTASVGDVIYVGGDGGAGTSGSYAGGGGGGAGSTGSGGSATNETAGSGTSDNGGNGGAGTNVTNTRNNGSTYGGGGSGGIATTTTDRAGGNGAAGYMRITY